MDQIPRGRYRHYKGNEYMVVGIAKHSETLEDMVIYRDLDGRHKTWVRPLSMWDNPIEIDGRIVERFEPIGEVDEPCGLLENPPENPPENTPENTPENPPENTSGDFHEALRSIESTISKCEKALIKLRAGTPQYTLTKRRIEAFRFASELIQKKIEVSELG